MTTREVVRLEERQARKRHRDLDRARAAASRMRQQDRRNAERERLEKVRVTLRKLVPQYREATREYEQAYARASKEFARFDRLRPGTTRHDRAKLRWLDAERETEKAQARLAAVAHELRELRRELETSSDRGSRVKKGGSPRSGGAA